MTSRQSTAFILCLLMSAVLRAAEPAAAITNGGFEQWRRLTTAEEKSDSVRNVRLDPPHMAPAGWLPGRELVSSQNLTCRIARDEQVKHGGRCSVRIENGDPRDVVFLQRTVDAAPANGGAGIRPNRRYAVRWWLRGEKVQSADAGPILMLAVLSTRDGKAYRTGASETRRPLPSGTFDWQQRELIFITDSQVTGAVFNFQLRWATGSVWYDDVELVDLGPVTPVETY